MHYVCMYLCVSTRVCVYVCMYASDAGNLIEFMDVCMYLVAQSQVLVLIYSVGHVLLISPYAQSCKTNPWG